MGQKVHPEAMRVGYIHDWKSNWFSEKQFSDFLIEDVRIRDHITNKLAHAGLSDITIRKDAGEVEVNIHTARPGIVIGKSGSEVDALRRDLHRLTGKAIKVNILEIKRPELDAKLVAQSIAEQLQNRVAFRRAMKRALTSAMRSGAKGCKIQVSGRRRSSTRAIPSATRRGYTASKTPAAGRLGGAEMARRESYSDGRVPLHTMRADIDYGFHEARTTFGRIGVKCWINKGEIMPEGYTGADLTEMEAPQQQSNDRGDGRGGRGGRDGGRGGGRGGRGGGPGGPGGRGGGPGGPGGPGGGRGGGRGGRGRGGGGGGGERAAEAAAAVAAVPAAAVPAAADRAEVAADAVAQARQAPQAAPRAAGRALARPDDGAVRRVRHQDARGRLADEPPDRGRAYRDDPQDQARRQGLDQRLSRQARHEEAGRDPHGLRQGQPRGLGGGRQARPRDVRAGRRAGAARPRGDAPRRAQAAREDQVRAARGPRRMTARELRDLDDDELVEHIRTQRREAFGLRFQLATGELENTAGVGTAKRDLARALTVARQRGLDPDSNR